MLEIGLLRLSDVNAGRNTSRMLIVVLQKWPREEGKVWLKEMVSCETSIDVCLDSEAGRLRETCATDV